MVGGRGLSFGGPPVYYTFWISLSRRFPVSLNAGIKKLERRNAGIPECRNRKCSKPAAKESKRKSKKNDSRARSETKENRVNCGVDPPDTPRRARSLVLALYNFPIFSTGMRDERSQAYPIHPRLIRSFVPSERLPNHEHLLKNQ